jgi:hypothetical protein
MATAWDQWHPAFLERIREPGMAETLKQAALAEILSTWTSSLTTAVVQSCEALGWAASARWHPCRRLPQAGKEYLSIDVTALPGGTAPLWPFPLAVFELENHRTDRRVAYSLWKVLCIRAGLRVVIAYRPDWEQTRRLVTRLAEDVVGGLRPEERTTLGGQTVLVVGNRGEGETFPWGYFKFWMLDVNLGRFGKVV